MGETASSSLDAGARETHLPYWCWGSSKRMAVTKVSAAQAHLNFFQRQVGSHQWTVDWGTVVSKTTKGCLRRMTQQLCLGGGRRSDPELSESQGLPLSQQGALSGRIRVAAMGTQAGMGECGLK